MTLVEVFVKVREHLLRQGTRSADGPRCQYRGSGGRMCAIGCLIPDEAYDPLIEGVAVYQLIPGQPATLGWLPDEALLRATGRDIRAGVAFANALNAAQVPVSEASIRLLRSLQRVHDAHGPDSWAQELELLRQELLAEGRVEFAEVPEA